VRFLTTIFSLFIGSFFFSCSKQSPNTIEATPIINLIGTPKLLYGADMRYPFRIRITDSSLYIMDLHGSEEYIHQFTYPGLKYVESFGKKGDGPGEFLDIENIRFDSQGQLWVLDANQKKIIRKTSSGLRETELPEALIRTLDFALYNDSTFIVPDYTGKYRYSLVNSKGTIIKNSGQIPTTQHRSEASNIALAQAWRSFIDYNPQNNILAMATQLGEVLEIYDVKNDSIIHIATGESGEPLFRNNGGMAIPNGIMGYSDVYVGKKNIYVLFWGYSFKDMQQGLIKSEGGDNIQIFDLKGKPIQIIHLDHKITGFCINEKKQTVIGLDVNSNQPLLEYSLPKLI